MGGRPLCLHQRTQTPARCTALISLPGWILPLEPRGGAGQAEPSMGPSRGRHLSYRRRTSTSSRTSARSLYRKSSITDARNTSDRPFTSWPQFHFRRSPIWDRRPTTVSRWMHPKSLMARTSSIGAFSDKLKPPDRKGTVPGLRATGDRVRGPNTNFFDRRPVIPKCVTASDGMVATSQPPMRATTTSK